MPGPMRGPRGAKPKIENPGKLFGRLMGYVLKNYTPHIVVVVICIFVGVFSNIQGTLFMQTLIDNYIVPLLGTDNPDFSGLANAITRVATSAITMPARINITHIALTSSPTILYCPNSQYLV